MWVVPGGREGSGHSGSPPAYSIKLSETAACAHAPPRLCGHGPRFEPSPNLWGLDTNRLSLGARGARYRYTDVRRSDRDVRAADRGPTVGRAHTHAQNIRSRSHTPGGASASTPTPRASSLTDPLKAPPTAQRPLARSSLTHYSPTRRHAAARLAALPRESSLL